MPTRKFHLAVLLVLAGLLMGGAATADTPAYSEIADRQAVVDPEAFLATPAAPTDNRGFQQGDSVTLVRERGDYKRTVTYAYAGNDSWQLISNMFAQMKPKP